MGLGGAAYPLEACLSLVLASNLHNGYVHGKCYSLYKNTLLATPNLLVTFHFIPSPHPSEFLPQGPWLGGAVEIFNRLARGL